MTFSWITLLVLPTLLFSAIAAPTPQVNFRLDINIKMDTAKDNFLVDLGRTLKNVYLPAMLNTIANYPHDSKAKFAVEASFGKNLQPHDIEILKTGIQTIANYHATIDRPAAHWNPSMTASFDTHTQKIYIGNSLFLEEAHEARTREDWKKVMRRAAPTLIHEITHGPLHTVDYFTKKDFIPDRQRTLCVPPGSCYAGYLPLDYKVIRGHGFATQVVNADAYFVFAHLSVYGDVNLDDFDYQKHLWAF